MPFDFFESGVANGTIQLANEKIRDLQQAAISEKWDATSAKYIVKEQDDYGSKNYHDIEVWIDYVVGMTSRGVTNGDDFRKLLFENIDHEVKEGLYYQFDGNTWITYFTDKYSSLDVDIGVRRCNNIMKIVDPENGGIFSIPCVVEYDMTAPSIQVSSSILTPNNHAVIKVQGNDDTIRLFKLNTRYILGGRPFKLLAYQNALIDKTQSPIDTLLELDLFLDELKGTDDIENQLADNGKYDYTIDIDADDMSLTTGTTGVLKASVSLNGAEVNRKIVWKSLNDSIVQITQDGHYEVVGENGQECTIVASLDGNSNVVDTINIKVVSVESLLPKIIIEPMFNILHQYETISFEIRVMYGTDEFLPENSSISLSKNANILSNKFVDITKNGNAYTISAKTVATTTIPLYISVENNSPEFKAADVCSIGVVSMLG